MAPKQSYLSYLLENKSTEVELVVNDTLSFFGHKKLIKLTGSFKETTRFALLYFANLENESQSTNFLHALIRLADTVYNLSVGVKGSYKLCLLVI